MIDILNFGAPLILVAIGMTLVVATKGIDLSVGSIVAISGAIACLSISRGADQNSMGLILTSVLLAAGLSLMLGGLERTAGLRGRDSADYCHADSNGCGKGDRPAHYRRTDYYGNQH
ncbi:hypothetical protein ACFSQ7_31885 [Paenibacillus rhizoplanae]